MLQQMFPAETVSAAVDGAVWQKYLQRVMAKLRLELRPFAVKVFGHHHPLAVLDPAGGVKIVTYIF